MKAGRKEGDEQEDKMQEFTRQFTNLLSSEGSFRPELTLCEIFYCRGSPPGNYREGRSPPSAYYT